MRIKITTGILIGAALAAQTPTSVWDGVFNDAQASSGTDLYAKQCASCHGDKLQGKGQAPALTGEEFMQSWSGQSVGDLFEKVQTTMPADHPGSLSRDQNASIVAFMFKNNGFPAGKAAMPTAGEALAKIKIDAKK